MTGAEQNKSKPVVDYLHPLHDLRNVQFSILAIDPSSCNQLPQSRYLSEEFNWQVTDVATLTTIKFALRDQYFDLILLKASADPESTISHISTLSNINAAPVMVISDNPEQWAEFVRFGAEDFFDENQPLGTQAARIYAWMRQAKGDLFTPKDHPITDEVIFNSKGQLLSGDRVVQLEVRTARLLRALLAARGRYLSVEVLREITEIKTYDALRSQICVVNRNVFKITGKPTTHTFDIRCFRNG